MTKYRKIFGSVFVIMAVFAFSACAPKIANHGNMLDSEKIAEIKVGESTREDCINKLGSPTQTGVFDDKVWYYFGHTTEQYSFLDPKVIEQKAIEIRFNDEGIVTAVNTLDPSQCREIEPVSRATPTYGHEMTFIEQLVGNLGQRAKSAKGKK